MDHKDQHFIPQCYQKAWCDPETPKLQEPYIWIFPKDGKGQPKRRAPHNVFYEKDTYTILKADGSRDLHLEHGLNQLETAFSNIRDEKLSQKKYLDANEHFNLCAFISAMQNRTVAVREHWRREHQKVLTMMDRMKEQWDRSTPEQRQILTSFGHDSSSTGPTLSHDDVRSTVQNPLQNLMVHHIQAFLTHLICCDYVLFEAKNGRPGFITSDNPCVFWDPESYKRPPFYRSPGFIYPSIEVRFPISPSLLIVFNRRGITGRYKVDEKDVDDFNSMTRFHAHEHYIVNQNFMKNEWLDNGTEPDDSWEKLHGHNP